MKNQSIQYEIVKIPIKELINHEYDMNMSEEDLLKNEYIIKQGTSPLLDQIERLRGERKTRVHELVLLVAKKNAKQEEQLRTILTYGFWFNGIHYSRFGKSASQGKDGITAFVSDDIFDTLYTITQMDVPMKECVISKYEAQRCLPFSSCTLIKGYIPNIVIIDEYEKILKDQWIKYVVEREKEFVDQETGETKTYNSREIEEGYRDIKLSPFDGCGCSEMEFMERVSDALGLDYTVSGCQVRLPFVKGYTCYVPFREILKSWGHEYITDVYGTKHHVDDIDCIWNTSMFKGHKIFKDRYGNKAWSEYVSTLKKYRYCLGISKYAHHVKHINKYTRMNFQYLQCLDLWNEKYIDCYEKKQIREWDALNPETQGKIISVAKYSTDLFEKIIKGDKFYTYKFMGINDTSRYDASSKYLEAALINDTMLHDPAVQQFIYRKLKKTIDEAKVGKIYASGFYHTGVGDMIGYLQYAVGEEPIGCLKERELYTGNFPEGDILSFRSPLVDPSEVNKIKVVHNDLTEKWFSSFKDQDIVMFNMYDISAPQQGGADYDGDIFFLCNDPVLLQAKIDKPIILDIDDKATAKVKRYCQDNITDYEVVTRDNRIGEITNCATAIENRYTTNEDVKKMYEDDCSLLRIYQGEFFAPLYGNI